jgi:hypothetical protein
MVLLKTRLPEPGFARRPYAAFPKSLISETLQGIFQNQRFLRII